jgi:hypothetical protein
LGGARGFGTGCWFPHSVSFDENHEELI